MRGVRQRLRTLGKQRRVVPAPLPLIIRRGVCEEQERGSLWNSRDLRIKRLTPDGEVYEWVVPAG
jgi:hypothetical protein